MATLVLLPGSNEGKVVKHDEPAGRDFGPAIPAADRAIEGGSAESLLKLMEDALPDGVRKHFQDAVDRKNFSKDTSRQEEPM